MTSSNPIKEFDLSEQEFQAFVRIAYDQTGIVLSDQKREMLYSRLSRRLRALEMSSFSEYRDLLTQPQSEELDHFVNAITTNLTSFFREMHHFNFLKQTVFPDIQKADRTKNKVRIWSAGCSTGEEPYSLAMLLLESFPKMGWDIKVLATDLDSNVLNHGRQGIYDFERIKDLNKQLVKRWFFRESPQKVQVKPDLQQIIRFNRLNLLGSWPMKHKFDVIFCRNVLIYFNRETQAKLFERYANLIKPQGYLMIGHSESISKDCQLFKPIGKTIYQKVS